MRLKAREGCPFSFPLLSFSLKSEAFFAFPCQGKILIIEKPAA